MAATAATIVANWQSAMSNPNAATKYKNAINAVTESPMAAAATPAAQQAYAQGTAAAVSSGKMAKKLNAVSLASWKAATTGAGAQALTTTGVQKGLPKMQAASAQIASAGAAAKAAAAAQTSPLGKVQAAIQATQQAWGYTPTV